MRSMSSKRAIGSTSFKNWTFVDVSSSKTLNAGQYSNNYRIALCSLDADGPAVLFRPVQLQHYLSVAEFKMDLHSPLQLIPLNSEFAVSMPEQLVILAKQSITKHLHENILPTTLPGSSTSLHGSIHACPFPSAITLPQSPYAIDRTQPPYAPYPALPMSPGPALAGAYVDPNQNLVWLPPPFAAAVPTPQPYQYHHDQAQQYYNNLQSQYGAPDPYMYGGVPPRPSSAGPFLPESTSTAAALLSPALRGMPISSATQPILTSMFGSTPTLPPLPGSAVHRSPSTVSRSASVRYGGIDTGRAPIEADINGEEGTGQRASRIARNLRGRRYPLPAGTGSAVPHPVLAPLDTSFHDSPVTLKTPLHSPRPVLSPKQSFTKVTEVSNSGGMVSKSVPKSERVEELERMADEVGTKTKDLSGDLPLPDMDNDDEPPPVPTMTDKASNGKGDLAAPSTGPQPSRARSRSRSHAPPTPATPTLTRRHTSKVESE
ncbi:hypothetical protein BT96DRAFT_1009777 [Gymnopus androsaceus JB14]|uniref:Uncharacterized protein n=1 Tax=Gymnopus androsaceus JB14 TaxID=1447944 RepID=A0A6A4GBW6_9AGAR|nr:hypothetical protein BT96DRAFT_1009777 [Gymnopus androsaceus JB14]